MVTKNQIAQLSAHIDALADQFGLTEKPTYRVWLSFTGESDEEFYARHPDARGCRHQGSSSRWATMRVPLQCRATKERIEPLSKQRVLSVHLNRGQMGNNLNWRRGKPRDPAHAITSQGLPEKEPMLSHKSMGKEPCNHRRASSHQFK